MNTEVEISIGTIIADQWTVSARIGAGSFGTVYRCCNGVQMAALKTEPVGASRPCLKTEAWVLRKVFSSGVAGARFFCRLLSQGEQPTYRYILMSYGGEPLKTLRNRCGGRLSPETSLNLAIQLLQSIRALHNIDILHGDIKEDNVCVHQKQLYLIDLGLACSYTFNGKHRSQKKREAESLEADPASENFELYYSRKFELRVWDYVFRGLLFGSAEINGPEEISRIRVYIEALQFTEQPDYELIEEFVRTYILNRNYDISVPYDWESGRRYIEEIVDQMEVPMLPAGALSYDDKVHSA